MMVSWAWCIVRNEILYITIFNENTWEFCCKLGYISYVKIPKKLKCEIHSKCVAYTFEQSRLICVLHSSTDKGQKYTRGKQTGVKKTDYKLSLPEISLCFGQRRQRRCRLEPKCNHVDCFRNAQDFWWNHYSV